MSATRCAVKGCGEPVARVIAGEEFCVEHRAGDLVPEVPIVLCAVRGCDGVPPHVGEEFCWPHRWEGA